MNNMNKMASKRYAFFGTPYVARDTLAHLIAAGYTPSVAVTSPDAPRGRGHYMTPCETKVLAHEHSIPTLSPQVLDEEFRNALQVYECEYAIVVAYGKIIPQSIIDMFPQGILNIHYSLLPKYRGASPVESALLHNDTHTGVAIQRMVYTLDAGDILAMQSVEIFPHETTRELRPRLILIGAKLLTEILLSFEAGTATFTPQAHSRATVCKKIKKEDGLLNLVELATDPLENWLKYRAYAESPGTYFFHGDTRIKIKTATYDGTHFTPLRVVPEGKKEMEYQDWK